MKSLLLLSLLLLVHAAWAANLNGRWSADSTFPRGVRVTEYFDLQADGGNLRGSFTDAFGGRHEIRDGRVRGEHISFWMHWEKQDKCQVTGVIREATIDFRLVTPGATRAVTAKRAP